MPEGHAPALPGRAGRSAAPFSNRPWTPLSLQLAGTGQVQSRLDALEQARAPHQVVGHAGALVVACAGCCRRTASSPRGSRSPRLALCALRTGSPRGSRDSGRMPSRSGAHVRGSSFMANPDLWPGCRPKTLTVQQRPARSARGLDTSGTLEGLDLMRQSMERILDGLATRKAAWWHALTPAGPGLRLLEGAGTRAVACGRSSLTNAIHKETHVAEQLAVCLESGRTMIPPRLLYRPAGRRPLDQVGASTARQRAPSRVPGGPAPCAGKPGTEPAAAASLADRLSRDHARCVHGLRRQHPHAHQYRQTGQLGGSRKSRAPLVTLPPPDQLRRASPPACTA